jgi:TonB-linked SusC/RagA family outer membrane protein
MMKLYYKAIQIFLIGVFACISLTSYAQKRVTGTVVDSVSENPIAGAVVIVEGTSAGTATDTQGNFALTVPSSGERLSVSFFGYETATAEIGERERFRITLEQQVMELDEVVVVGYGEMRRSDITGAVSSVNINKTEASQVDSFDRLLQGRVAGVDVVTGSYAPGGAVSITIRGSGSINSSTEPLYVVDGIIINGSTSDVGSALSGNSYNEAQNSLAMINPRDIASMEILKDASATAIYGSQGANGVVLITTKQGNSEKPVIDVSSTFDLGWRTKVIDVLDMEGFLNFRNDVGSPVTLSPEAYEINWQDYVQRRSFSKSMRVSVSGKSGKSKYYIAGGFSDGQGILKKTGVKQSDFRINLTSDIGKYVTLGTNSAISYRINNMMQSTDGPTSSNTSAFGSMVRQMINSRPYKQDNLEDDDGSTDFAVGADRWLADYEDLSTEYRVVPSLFAEVKIMPWLKFRSTLGADYRNKERIKYEGPLLARPNDEEQSRIGISRMVSYRYNMDNQLNFDLQTGKSRINAMIGMSASESYQKNHNLEGWNMTVTDFRQEGLNYASQVPLSGGMGYMESSFTLFSYFGRAVYSYDDRYNLTATFRADGSSKFAKQNKYGYFPSFAFAWRINQESFLKDVSQIDNLKLRLSWGQVGNQSLAPYQTLDIYSLVALGTWDPALGQPGFTYGLAPYSFGGTIANPDLRWETSEQYNAGLDISLFSHRLNATVDLYRKDTRNLLLKASIPPSSANGSTDNPNNKWVNRGIIRNRGLEIGLHAVPIQSKDFSWEVSGNISFNRNKILSLGAEQFGDFGMYKQTEAFYGTPVTIAGAYFSSPANIFMKGYPQGMFFGYETGGLCTDPEDPYLDYKFKGIAIYNSVNGVPVLGMRKYIDQNGDGMIDADDRTIIGNPNPKFTGGFSTSLTYKGLSLDVAFSYVYGNQIANGNNVANWSTGQRAKNFSNNIVAAAYYNAWNAETNPGGTAPALLSMINDTTTDFQDWIIEDGSYLRLSNITLVYRFGLEKLHIRNIAVSVTGRNLWLLSDYSGFDPDVNSFAGDANGLRKGVDYGSYPNSKGVIFGLNLTF